MNDDCTAEVINLIKTDEAKRNVSTVNRNYAIGSVIIVLVFLFAVLVFSLNYKKRKRNRDHLKAENDILSKFQSESDFVTSDIYLLFHDPKAKTTARDFILLEQSLNHTYSNFTIRLKQKYPKMTTVELQICCLVKIGLSVKDLTRYYPYSRANYTMIRSRLYKKITGKEGNGKDFDDYILHF